jgi:AcrR family transcriptional regulator
MAAPALRRRDRLRQRRVDGAREELFAAARAVLARVGVGGLTVERVARELGVTKQALYHYFRSKDALLFEVVHAEMAAAAATVHAACQAAPDGIAALEAVIRAYVGYYAPRLEIYRLVTMHVQQADLASLEPAMLARIRPLNDVMFGLAAARLHAGRGRRPRRDPRAARRMVFAAHLAAHGLLTMKALVERFADPLRYRDDELVDELCRGFRASAEKEGYA